MNTENIKMNEPHKFVLSLSQRSDLRSSNKYVAFQKLSIYYTWKNKRQYKTIKLKVIARTWNDEFALADGSYSVSDSQDYIGYIIKSMINFPLILLFIFTSVGLIID